MSEIQDKLFDEPLTIRQFLLGVEGCDSRAYMYMRINSKLVAIYQVQVINKNAVVFHPYAETD